MPAPLAYQLQPELVELLPRISGLLQLLVGLYAFRLVRLFGSKNVGWWLTGAFAAQALLSWLHFSGTDPSSLKVDFLYLLLSICMLVSMAQIERSQRDRLRRESDASRIRSELERTVDAKTAELRAVNHGLKHEIERRQEFESALRASEEQYRFLFTENPQPMWVYDRETFAFLALNSAALKQYLIPERSWSSLSIADFFTPDARPHFLADNARPATSVENRGLWCIQKGDGSTAQVEAAVTDLTYQGRNARLVLAADVTGRLNLERQLRQSQKMEAIGQLAGGVAHDFNNLLTIIQGYADLLLADNHTPRTGDHLRQISGAAQRAAGLTRQLLAFSRRHHLQLTSVDLNDTISNLARMLRRLIGEDIALETHLAAIPPVHADASMLEQVILNLSVNARDAISPGGGTITITTSRANIDPAQAQHHPDARPGNFVRISVRDTGCGMSPEVMAHLFEPFYTTKELGKGTGLGLATVYGIVKQHSGWLEVQTAPGKGSEFIIFLPPSAVPVAATSPHLRAPPSGTASGTILLVEDEDQVREYADIVLSRQGYKVITAASGSAALTVCKQRADEIDLVFTDMVMPGGMSGRDLADQLRAIKPDAKVLFTSGYSPSRCGQNLNLLNGLKFLPKPYNPQKLLSTISEALIA